jgi:hypothetical protein
MSEATSKLQPLEEALERVSKKQKVSYSKTLSQIDHLLNEVNKCKMRLQPGMLSLSDRLVCELTPYSTVNLFSITSRPNGNGRGFAASSIFHGFSEPCTCYVTQNRSALITCALFSKFLSTLQWKKAVFQKRLQMSTKIFMFPFLSLENKLTR